MFQTITALIITALAVLVALRSIYRFFRSPDDAGCTPDKCSRCSAAGSCTPLEDGGFPHKKNMPFPKTK